MRVLIIDDDEDLRNLLAVHLKKEWPDIEIEEFDPLTRDMPDGLADYQRLMDKLIEKDRDARFRNADEVIGFLSRKFEQLPVEAVDRTQKIH